MGVHYLNASLLNGEVDATQPQALIYEPLGGGKMRLVGVEFIVDAATWQKQNAAPPQLYQQLLQLIPSPNRYGLNTFYELHVWAWQDNPNGAFVDWNNKVTATFRARLCRQALRRLTLGLEMRKLSPVSAKATLDMSWYPGKRWVHKCPAPFS